MIDKVLLKGVRKSLEGHLILNQVNMELNAGRIYGFVGENGSGKTMLLRMIAGLVHPNEGEIVFYGENGAAISIDAVAMGVMIENAGLYSELSAFDNLAYLASIRQRITKEEIAEILIRLGFDPRDKKKSGKYSLGMRQRLTFAQAVMEHPDVLLLDEPTNALDRESVPIIRKMIQECRESGAVICISSHNGSDISALCDEIFIVRDHSAHPCSVSAASELFSRETVTF